jgi:hypothetical protein
VSESAPESVSEQPNDGGMNSGWTPPASQVELNRIISERVSRERAKYADYEDLKSKAAQITEANEKAAQAEASVAEIPAKVAGVLRDHLVSLHGIEKDDADLFLTANDPELLLKQVQRLVGRGSSSTASNFVPREGTSTSAGSDGMREFTRSLFDQPG